MSSAQEHAADPVSPERGRKLVHATCETCHSLEPGAVKVGPSLYGALGGASPRDTAAQARAIMLQGRGKMPALGSILSAADVESIILFLRRLP